MYFFTLTIISLILPFSKSDMSFDEIMDKWPDAVMHYPTYMALSFHNKNRLKDVSIRWYQSGTYPLQSLNYTYNELISAEKDAFFHFIRKCHCWSFTFIKLRISIFELRYAQFLCQLIH